MKLARIYHPNLPGQHADVPESAVGHWKKVGWTEKPTKKAEAPEPSGASSSERSPRGRRTEGDES